MNFHTVPFLEWLAVGVEPTRGRRSAPRQRWVNSSRPETLFLIKSPPVLAKFGEQGETVSPGEYINDAHQPSAQRIGSATHRSRRVCLRVSSAYHERPTTYCPRCSITRPVQFECVGSVGRRTPAYRYPKVGERGNDLERRLFVLFIIRRGIRLNRILFVLIFVDGRTVRLLDQETANLRARITVLILALLQREDDRDLALR